MKLLNYLPFLCILASSLYSENLITNGDFKDWGGGLPANWIDRSRQSYSQLSDDGGMSVKLVKSSGRAGEMLQKIVVDPDKRYRVAGEVRGSQSGLAYIQVKTYANGKEVARHSTSRNKGTDWQEIEKVFSTQGVESIEILLRWR